jgi:ATP-dependent DNA helicase DinG
VSELLQAVERIFTHDGPLAQVDAHFRVREGQTQMAQAVAQTVEQGGALVVEAGTGVGKTFAYLVPALLSGERVVISTATKTLQDQLFGRDLPAVIRALKLPARMALLKGRANYLCLYRMALARQEGLFPDRYVVTLLAKVEKWSQRTMTGDLSELDGLDERSALLPMITSTRENCLGSECPDFKKCYVSQARKEALASDVVVINHHLFFADMSMKESGMAELLPNARVVIFDEAHQLNEIGVNFLGQQMGTSQLLDLARDVLATGENTAKGMGEWREMASKLELCAKDWRGLFAKSERLSKLAWTQTAPEGVNEELWLDVLQGTQAMLEEMGQAIEPMTPTAPEWLRLQERLVQLLEILVVFQKPLDSGFVRWLDVGAGVRLVQAPLDIAQQLGPCIMGTPAVGDNDGDESEESQAQDVNDTARLSSAQDEFPGAAAASSSHPKSWIFTSATLGHEPTLSWFTQPCGLSLARVLQVQSPFNYAKQSVLFVPKEIVLPSDPKHSEMVSDLSAKVVLALQGRTLVLTTTLRALKEISDRLKTHLQEHPHIEVLTQGEGSKKDLMQRFRSAEDLAVKRSFVLVATATFWEGFDVPGDALQAVVIDKLPFPPPNDPMVVARSKKLEESGKSPFNHYFLPEAGVALKQGAGRLIRRESDKGVLVVCDKRLVETGYGKRLIQALPPMARVSQESVLLEGLKRLTTGATKPELL